MTSRGPVSIPRFNPSPFDYGAMEIAAALAAAAAVQVCFFLLLALTAGDAKIAAKPEAAALERPISVKPVLDETPLLKLGGKKRAKLPDMWKKQVAVKRHEEKSAPSPQAAKTPDAIPTTPVATKDAEAPPPDAEIAKKVDEEMKLIDAAKPPESQAAGEGVADGVKEGTETDPLKGRAVSVYRSRIIAWFNARFRVPTGEIPCDELKKLSSRVSATVSPDGTVTGFSVGNPSGNGVFDGRVQSAMQGAVGQQVPPPPENYPDILPPNISLNFTGSSQKCAAAPAPEPEPAP
jgi:outer membrane biosynthesis protein TonB